MFCHNKGHLILFWFFALLSLLWKYYLWILRTVKEWS